MKSPSLNKNDLELIEAAKKHIKTHYRKGQTSMAALLSTKRNKVYTAINIKYKAVWKCICAERVAIAKAIEAGENEFDTLVTVKYEPDTQEFLIMNMCGECRQIAMFHKPLNVIANDDGKLQKVPIEKVFPYPYS